MVIIIPKLQDYPRKAEAKIKSRFFGGKVIVIVGPRQVGKTTLALKLGKDQKKLSFNCDNPTDRELLNKKDLEFLRKVIGNNDIVIIDEGQKVETIGETLKLLADHYKKDKQFIVTGSSSINLLDNTVEPLTGRKAVYMLYPLSMQEIYPKDRFLTFLKELEEYLIFGSYPEVVAKSSFDEKKELLKELSSSYLYRDILEFQLIRNSNTIFILLKALALQIGSEVSYNELSRLVGVDKKTVERYIDLLEKSHVIFKLPPYTKNKRREITRHNKIYFYDLGIRNAIINNFNYAKDRDDTGQLFENFCILERMKFREYNSIHAEHYFWRSYDGSEIDLIEERDGKAFAYEFKFGEKKAMKMPAGWYRYKVISKKELADFIL